MTITDTHTHLYSEAFDEDREEMMQRALDAGVERFFIPAIDSTYTQAMLDLETNYPNPKSDLYNPNIIRSLNRPMKQRPHCPFYKIRFPWPNHD